jgi:hypothetical protein
MKLKEIHFANCSVAVIDVEVPDPENERETLRLKQLKIFNPDEAETYVFTMTEQVRATLVEQLTGGVVLVPATALPAREIKH